MGWAKERVFGSKITTFVGLACVALTAIGMQIQTMDGMVDLGKVLQGLAMLVGGLANIFSRD